MSDEINIEEADLSDAELIQVLKNHGISRRGLMQLFGVGAVVSVLGGTAAGSQDRNARIDEVFGASYSTDETPPSGLVDHVVELHVHEHGDGDHEGFPAPDDSVDADRMKPGFQPDDDDFDDLPEFHFEPVGLHVNPGEVVEFRNISTEHTVTAFHPKWSNPLIEFPRRVPSDVPGFTSPPYVEGESWLYRFTTKGVYDIFCFPHLPPGMVMRVVVYDPNQDDLTESKFDDYDDLGHPAFRNANLVLNAPELDDPAAIVNAPNGTVAWDKLTIQRPDGTSLPPSLPRPRVNTLSVSEAETNSGDAEFNVEWSVSIDPDVPSELGAVRLTLTDDTDREIEDLACDLLSGGSAGDTTRLVAPGDDGSGNDYQVELVVTNNGGLSTTDIDTATEDGS